MLDDVKLDHSYLMGGLTGGRVCRNQECIERLEKSIAAPRISDWGLPIWPAQAKPMRLLTGGPQVPVAPWEYCPWCGAHMQAVQIVAYIQDEVNGDGADVE